MTWYIAPYKARPAERDHARYVAVDDFTSQIVASGGYWAEIEILGPGLGQAIVRVDTPEPDVLALLDGEFRRFSPATAFDELRNMGHSAAEISERFGSDVGVHSERAILEWMTRLVRKPRKQGNQVVLDGEWRACPKTLDELAMEFEQQLPPGVADRTQFARWTTAPTTGILDNFNRANEGPPPSSNWTNLENGLKVVSNACAGNAGTGANNKSYWNVAQYGPNAEAYATMATLPGNNNDVEFDLKILAYGGASEDGYRSSYTQVTGTDEVVMYRVDNAVATQLGALINQGFSAGDGWGTDYLSGTLAAYRRASGTWSSLGTRSDSTYSSQSGYIGINMESTTGRLDDFGGGTTVVAAGKPWHAYAQQ